MFKSIWFVLVTFTTVGYGDIYPATAQGKLAAAISILLGILFTAMPITIMGQVLLPDGYTDGYTDGCVDGCIDCCTDSCTDGYNREAEVCSGRRTGSYK